METTIQYLDSVGLETLIEALAAKFDSKVDNSTLTSYPTQAEVTQQITDAVTNGKVDLTGYAKEEWVGENYQPVGDYATNSQVDTKIATALSTIDTTVFVVTDTLPETPSEGNENKIHVVPVSDPSTDATNDKNTYVEWLWIAEDSKWEKLGEFKAEISLEGYATEDWVNSQISDATEQAEEWIEENFQPKGDYATKEEVKNELDPIKDELGPIKNVLFGELAGEVGDVVLIDKDTRTNKTVVKVGDLEKYKDTHSPIGVVVIPASHDVYGTGECGVISMRFASFTDPDQGSTNAAGMMWGHSGANIDLPDHDVIAHLGMMDAGFISNGVVGTFSSGYIPTMKDDINKGNESPTDPGAWYSRTNYPSFYCYAPSPYLEDGSRNPDYYKTDDPSSPANALSDFDGKGNTEILTNLATGQVDWRFSGSIANWDGDEYSPAACACWRYHTMGTMRGDWYLPALGELGYLAARYDVVKSTFTEIARIYGGTPSQLDDSFEGTWSSTECDSETSYKLVFREGLINPAMRDSAFCNVRPFTRIKFNATIPKNRLDDHINESEKKFDELVSKIEETKECVEEYIDSQLYDDATNGYEYVDMGEAGIWAKYPIGVSEWNDGVLDKIKYFEWGGIEGYTRSQVGVDKQFSLQFTDYRFSNGGVSSFDPKLTKYCDSPMHGNGGFVDTLTTLLPEDDAAHVNMGGAWRMPTRGELQNLYDLCNKEFVNDYNGVSGLSGVLLTLKTDSSKQVFLPAAGSCSNGEISGTTRTELWSSSLTSYGTTMAICFAYGGGIDYPNGQSSRTKGVPVLGFQSTLPKTEKYLTKKEAKETYQPKGDYVLESNVNPISTDEINGLLSTAGII